jgi:dihydroxyacetone kinase
MEKMSKKLINLPEKCVDEMLDGFVRAHPGLCLHSDNRVVLTKQVSIWLPSFKVS